MTQLNPLQDNVIVKPLESQSTTASGIVIPDTISKEKPRRGTVLSIGPGKEGVTLTGVKEGDVVVFTQYAPTEIKVDGEELYILGFDSILAVEA